MPDVLLAAHDLTKSFGAVQAVRGMDLEIASGEVRGLIGENGAGKSTLLSMISGRIRPDSGLIVIDGQSHSWLDPRMARSMGISVVYQELTLCANLTVAENIFLGGPPTRARMVLRRRDMRVMARQIIDSIGADIDPDSPVMGLRPAEQQLTEIARALAQHARVLILDEPTSSLTRQDFERLRGVLEALRESGVGLLFVSHRLSEIFELCQSVTVMRDGHAVGTLPAAEATEAQLVSMMVGHAEIVRRPRAARSDQADRRSIPARLEVRNASRAGAFEAVSLEVRPGEIVGLAGLRGSGRHELTEAIYGLDALSSGELFMDGESINIHSPKASRSIGMTYVPQERRAQGIIGIWDVQRNLALGNLGSVTAHGLVNEAALGRWAQALVERFGIVPADCQAPVLGLSGGNQQKVVVARNLAPRPRLLILVEPTRGVDVAAKADIATIVMGAADDGAGVLVVDSEVAELLAICDRIYVMHRGRMAGELRGAQMTDEAIATLGAGGVLGPSGPTREV